MTTNDYFMIFWSGYTLFMSGIIIAIVVWAIRNKQFTRQDRASRLPLEIEDDNLYKSEENGQI